jgi:hypothetical protein
MYIAKVADRVFVIVLTIAKVTYMYSSDDRFASGVGITVCPRRLSPTGVTVFTKQQRSRNLSKFNTRTMGISQEVEDDKEIL